MKCQLTNEQRIERIRWIDGARKLVTDEKWLEWAVYERARLVRDVVAGVPETDTRETT
jgi:hypothetical protein